MKRWMTILFLLFLVMIGAVYFFIPTKQNFTYKINANCTESAASRLIIDNSNWQAWWPGKQKNDSIYNYKNCDYKVNKILLDGVETTIFNNEDSIKGFLQIAPGENNTTRFQWKNTFILSANPVNRFIQCFQFRKTKDNIESLLVDVKKYFDKDENMYGFKVTEQKVTDSSLISVKQSFTHYPTTQEIYELIASLKEYIKQKSGEEVNYPMLNVYMDDSTNYQAMVAIPTKSDLASEGKFQLKKMVLGNILMAEVKGGIHSVMNGEKELTNYVNDYQKVSPAIPYQSLVTNRLAETDTSKWITRLYYPVFY